MKKALIVLATMLAVASAQATSVWNINWTLGGGWAYSPATDSEDAGVLDDYNVTWSLIDAGTGLTLAGATMTANKGGTLSFDDTGNGGGKASFLTDLEQVPGSGTATWFGSDNDGNDHYVYQYIKAWNDTEAWEWSNKLDPMFVKTANTDDEQFPAPTSPSEIIIGRSDFTHNSDANTYWTKVTAVPEPATMSLLGLGALAMVLRRKLRK